MTGRRVERRLAAILAADVAGYSKLMGADEIGTLSALMSHRREVIDPAIAEHNGRIVKTTGDGLLVEFASAVDALTCAAAVQINMVERNSEAEPKITFRMGINVGDIIVEGEDIFGDAVNIAARVETECEPGNVYLSDDAFRQVRGKTAFAFDDLGERMLKNVDRPVHIYRVRLTVAAGTRKPLPLPERPSIAVLPFQDMSGEHDQEYFADGIAEEIITTLSRWRWFLVIARNSSFTYRGRSVDARQVGRELGARYVLEGSVRKAGRRIRVTAQLIDAASGTHIWAERYDHDLADIFAIQDEVAQRVGAAIEPALSRNEIDRARHKTAEQMVAYDHLMRGIWHFHQFSAEDATKAIACFKRAIELDDTLAEAHAGIARAVLSRAMYGFPMEPGANLDASDFARKALAIDPANSTACYALALILAHREDSDTALTFARRAIQLNDNYTPGYFALAVASTFAGHPDEALSAIDRALRLSPADPQRFAWLAQRASALYLLKRYEDAMDSARQGLRLRWFHTGCRVLATSYAQLDMTEPAQATMRELLGSEHGDKTIREVIRPFKRTVDKEHYAEGLRKAGMPE